MLGPVILATIIFCFYKAFKNRNQKAVVMVPVQQQTQQPAVETDVDAQLLFEFLPYLFASSVKTSRRRDAAFQMLAAIEDYSSGLPDVVGVPRWDNFLSKYRRNKLEKAWLIPNFEPFLCSICMSDQASGQGVHLQTCLHEFCKECLHQLIKTSTEPEVKCPFVSEGGELCNQSLLQNEIRALVPSEDFGKFLERSLQRVESQNGGNAFHCRTTDCPGWCILDEQVTAFNCPVCDRINCVACNAIHESSTCAEYRNLKKSDDASSKMLKNMLKKGDAMLCPRCKAIVQKKGGCDAIQCTMCKVDLCWATRGLRWGPAGRGDTSAGCKCSVWKRCHPKCQNCH